MGARGDGRLYNINYTIIKRSFQYFGVLLKSSTRLSSLVILKPPIEVSACSASFSIWNAKVKLLKNECVTRTWIIFRIHSYLTRNQKIKIDRKTIMGFLIKGVFDNLIRLRHNYENTKGNNNIACLMGRLNK